MHKKPLRKFTKLSSKNIVIGLILVLFLSMCGYLVFYPKDNPQTLVNEAPLPTEKTRTMCNNPRQTALEIQTNEPVFTKSDCSFAAYQNVFIKELDKTSCKRISQYVIVDKNNAYKQLYDAGSSTYNTYIIIKEADVKSFKSLGNNYYKDSSHLFFDAGNDYKVIEGVDVSTVQVLSTHYLKDKSQVIFAKAYGKNPEQKNLAGFDVGTFAVIQNDLNHEQYFKDKSGVYYEDNLGELSSTNSKIVDADANSFEVQSEYLLAKDENHVYYRGKIIEHLDAPTFEVLPHGYFRDAYGIYTYTAQDFRIITGSDACTFELINDKGEYDWSGYAKDKNQVYYRESIIEGADSKSFQVVESIDGVSKAFDKDYEYQGIFRK